MTAQALLGSWPAEAATVPVARRAVREWLRSHGQAVHLETAELVVSELVGNVVLHVGGEVQVRIAADDREVLLEVSDESPLPPHTRRFSASSSTGRGMRLVHSMSAAHGVHLSDNGKTVWVRLTGDASHRSDHEVAEQFAGVDWLQRAEALFPDGASAPGPAGQLQLPPPSSARSHRLPAVA